MPTTDPIQPLLDSIKTMEETFVQPSCNSKDPFIKYPSTGTPPVIDFNVPQTTAFTTYGYLCKYFPPAYFKAFTKLPPENNFYNTVKNMTESQVTEMFGTEETTKFVRGLDVNKYIADDSQAGAAGHVSFTNEQNAGNESHEGITNSTNALTGTVSYVKAPGTETYFIDPVMGTRKGIRAGIIIKEVRPVTIDRLNGQGSTIKYIAKPPVPVPRLIVIEEYTTVSYLGNYGAGRTVKTFSLLPGERTTISVRTYKDKITTVESSKNVLDSFGSSSATELDTLLQHEQGDISSTSDTSGGSGNSFSTNTDTQNSSRSYGISGGLNLGPLSIGGGYGRSNSDVSTSANGFSSTYDYNHTGVRQSNINALDSAMSKHVQQSNSMRQIDVNTSTSDTARSGEEDVTVREIKNVNLNNTLNFAFRQLLQEYTTITYLSNLKFAYTNGYPESYTVVDLNNLPNMLLDIIDTTDPTTMNNVLCKLLNPYCNVMNWQDDFLQFVEKVEIPVADCLNLGGNCAAQGTEFIFRINKECIDKYKVPPLDLQFNGVILSVKKQTLQTSSVYVDAMLGRGDALDCFNQKAQNAENIGAYINNLAAMQRLEDSMQTTANNQAFADQQLEMGTQQMEVVTKQIDVTQQQIDVIEGITEPSDKATLYKKVFGDCCDVPQSCCGGGCGCDCKDHEETPAP